MTSLLGFRASRAIVSAVAFLLLSLAAQTARSADAIFAPGEPIITGFSGVVSPASPPPGSDPLDRTFIDPDGTSLVIQKLEPKGPPKGQLINSETVFSATAKDVGQVFGIALDNAPEMTGAAAPNIYAAATSAFGLNLVVTGPDGQPVRSKTGAAGATFAPGQWGSAGGATGYPGSIWKIDGTTGEVSLFTTIATNSGAGLGDIVYDPASQQFFVSDLDTGLIYRLASDGTIIDSFDHGVTGRPTHGLAAVADDGSAIDVTDPSFDTEDPATWGFTQAERKVWGLGLRGGRLYYAVADGPSVWSVKINPDGSFGTARWELDVTGLPSSDEITHIVFDPAGRMILAQRGAQVGSYDYSVFAATGSASIVRYSREFPDDPSTPSSWVETPDTYATGFKPEGSNATGGAALGYDYDKYSKSFDGACSAYLWATGEALRDDPSATPPLNPPAQVAGLQGETRSLVRPANDPPRKSFFTDYDGNTDAAEAAKQGHVGGVAIWQDCSGSYSPPDILPPPHWVPPQHSDLSLDKWASPHACIDGGADWWCNFTIRVENTGTTPYFGPVSVNDALPAANPGATLNFWPQPPWSCSPTGPDAAACTMGPALLFPGDSVDLHEVVQLPKALTTACDLPNFASIDWPFWGHDDDPSDDFGFADAFIPGAPCAPPPSSGSDLSLSKMALPPVCLDLGIEWDCSYAVTVQNNGPGHYSGPITVKDTLSLNAPATVIGPWTCSQAGPVLTCHIIAPPVNVAPGWTSGFYVTAHIKKNTGSPICSLDNKANIAAPAGGSPSNLLPGNDFGTATAINLDPACLAPQPHTDLKVEKSAAGCSPYVYMGTNGYACSWNVTFTDVGPDNYSGPLTFKDASNGVTASTLQSVPGCTGAPIVETCAFPSVSLSSGVGVPFPITMFYPDGPGVCSVTNNISIIAPNPGSTPNPAGNDSSSASQPVPNPLCNPLAPELGITKTATGCASDPSSTDWLCDFDVVVTNSGGSPQPGPIAVTDFNGKPTTFSTPACLPAGPNWLCTHPGALAAGASWSFTATTHVDPTGVSAADCDVVNTVQITTPSSADPSYAAQASQKVPQLFINVGPGPVAVYCDPPSLKLAKIPGPCVPSSGGYDCSFTVKATSTGPDPYHGTVELDEVLPAGTSFKSADWTCVPTTGNDVHCSSPPKDLAVGQSVSMKIVIFVPKDVGIRSCAVTNTVNAAISAAVLHSSKGAQYTASATDQLPASACAPPQQCPRTQVKPGGGCCPDGTAWNGKQCAPPVVKPCPKDSSLNDAGACECNDGTHGTPGRCVPDQTVCPPDSNATLDGDCVCKDGMQGNPGRCVPTPPICAPDSRVNSDGVCVCKPGTHGKPGRCVPDQQTCAPDSISVNGQCVCKPGTKGDPGHCVPNAPVCAPDSTVNSDGICECKDGTHGKPGRCVPNQQTCAPDSVSVNGQCVCKPGTQGRPGFCVPVPQACPRDSREVNGQCVCRPGTTGDPGHCVPNAPVCAPDSVLNSDGICECKEGTHGKPGRCVPDRVITPLPATDCPQDSHFDRRTKACVCNPPLIGDPGKCVPQITLQVPLALAPR